MKQFIYVLAILLVCSFYNILRGQNVNYGYENWPGKYGSSKSGVKVPEKILENLNAVLTIGSNESSFFYKIPIDENDSIRVGRFQSCIFSTPQAAQFGLVQYLNELTTANKPRQLDKANFSFGDVAFGNSIDGVLHLVYTRNNIFVVIICDQNVAVEIGEIFDKLIKDAPDRDENQSKPTFNYNSIN